MVWSLTRAQCGRIETKCRISRRFHADVRGAVVPEDMIDIESVRLSELIKGEEIRAGTTVETTIMTVIEGGDFRGLQGRQCSITIHEA